jgi:hypothetical protein
MFGVRFQMIPLRRATMMASLCLVAASAFDITAARSDQTQTLTSAPPPKVSNRQMTPLDEGARHGLRLDAHEGDGVAWWPDVQFSNGTIELDIRGKDVLQQSFVGVAFHGLNETTFDAVYFRPFNFKSDDPVRRSHAVQYVSHPTYTVEQAADRAAEPVRTTCGAAAGSEPVVSCPRGDRVPVGSRVRQRRGGPGARHQAIERSKDRMGGGLGGNGSDGAFANLTVTPAGQ